MEGRIGGELARRFERFALALVEPEHMKSTPRTSLVLGVPVSPLILSHQNHPICTFRNHRMCTGIHVSKGKPTSSQKGKITSSHHTHLQRVFQWFRSWLSDWLVVCFQPTNRPYIQPKRLHHPEPKTTKRPGLSDLFSHSSSGVVF